MTGFGNHHSPTLGSFPDSDKDRAQTVEWKIFICLLSTTPEITY